MLVFKKVRWKNFLSTGDNFTEIDILKTDTSFIIGKNGSGKTTFIDAICFCLYNKPFRNINKPQLVNTVNNKNLVVEVEFNTRGKEYKIIRGIKPSVFLIYCDDICLNETGDSRDFQEILEKQILKIDYKTFTQISILGSRSYTPFMDLSAQNRREVVSDFLNLDIFTVMSNKAKEMISSIEKSLIEIEREQDSIEIKLEEYKKYKTQKKQDLDLLRSDIEKNIVSKQLTIDALKKSKEELPEYTDFDPSLIHSIEKKIREYESVREEIKASLSNHKKENSFFQKHDDCPTCNQKIDGKFKCEKIEKTTERIDELNSGLLILDTKIQELYSRLEKLKEEKEKNSILRNKIEMLNFKITAETDVLRDFDNQLKKLNEKQEENIEYDKKEEMQYEERLDSVLIEKSSKIKEKQEYQICLTLLKDTGIKSKIIKKYIPFINARINHYLQCMDFYVSFELDENFKETIKSRHRDTFSYSSFSEGEKMRLNLAIIFAWRDVASNRNNSYTNLLILDEVLDGSLDEEGVDDFLKILYNDVKRTNTFIITHRSNSIPKYDRMIEFVKKQNFSIMKEYIDE